MDNIRLDINNAMARIFCGSDEGIYIGGRLAFRESNGFVTLLRTGCSIKACNEVETRLRDQLHRSMPTTLLWIRLHVCNQIEAVSPQWDMRWRQGFFEYAKKKAHG